MLATIKAMAAGNQVAWTNHALDRMSQRGVRRADVFAAIASATKATEQADGGFKVAGGVDTDGDELTVVCRVEANLLIITVF